jgi:hypothetical protein
MKKHVFYKWSIDDFIEIPARKLKVGDEIFYAYGRIKEDAFGAIPLENVQVIPTAGVIIKFPLPVGANAGSMDGEEISVFWTGENPHIILSFHFEYERIVLIRRK